MEWNEERSPSARGGGGGVLGGELAAHPYHVALTRSGQPVRLRGSGCDCRRRRRLLAALRCRKARLPAEGRGGVGGVGSSGADLLCSSRGGLFLQ